MQLLDDVERMQAIQKQQKGAIKQEEESSEE
jgi:hypothetical protein